MNEIITAIEKKVSPNEEMVYRDLLALGCYLNFINKNEASQKVVKTVFNALGENKFKEFIKQINGYEEECVERIGAHFELKKLFIENHS